MNKNTKTSKPQTAKLGFLLLLFLPTIVLSQSYLQWGELKPGSYTVGFKTESKYDYTRTYRPKFDYDGKPFSGERARPIQMSIWYPAEKAENAKPVLFEEYVFLTAKEEEFSPLTAQDKETAKANFRGLPQARNVAPEVLDRLFQMETAAFKDATPQNGRFPLVLFAPGFSLSPVCNTIMCEYLASHGYVVAASPSMGATSRRMTFNGVGLETEARDLEFIIAALREAPFVDHDRIAAIGFSFGGLPVATLAMRNTDVDAIISLDSAIGFTNSYSILFQSPFFDAAKFRVPLLHLTTKLAGGDATKSFYDVLKYSNAHWVPFDSLQHFDFVAFGMLDNTAPGFGGRESSHAKAGSEIVFRYTLNFLNAYVKGDQSGLAMLQNPEKNGVPAGMLAVESKKALKAPPTEDQFVSIIREKGVEEAIRVFREAKKVDPEGEVFAEFVMNNLGYEFLGSNRAKEAIDVFKLNVEAYPESWNVYDSLAEGYMINGDTALAIEFYNKSLELNPDNTNGQQMLERIKASAKANN